LTNFFNSKKIGFKENIKIKSNSIKNINQNNDSLDNKNEKNKISPDLNINNIKEKYKVMNMKFDELPIKLNKK